nr:hypothetical protein [Nocardia higoensis]
MCATRAPAFDLVLGAQAAWISDRLPSADDLAQRSAVASGRDLGDWGFYSGLAHLKLAVIGEGIAYRALHGADPGSGAAAAAEATAELVAAGIRALRVGRVSAGC